MKTFFMQSTGIGLIFFIIISIYTIAVTVKDDINYLNKIEQIQEQVSKIEKNSALVLELQRERGLTSIYFASSSKKHLDKVISQRAESDKATLNGFDNLKESLVSLRLLADIKKESRAYVFNSYSELIRTLLLDAQSLAYNANEKELKNALLIYNDLNSLQEILGQLRAKVGVVLSANLMIQEQAKDIKRTSTLFQHQLETTFVNDILAGYKYTRLISKTKCLKRTLRVVQNLKQELNKKENRLSAIEWFAISTCAIDKIDSVTKKQIDIINQDIEMHMISGEKKRVQNLMLWSFGFIILSIFVYISLRKSKELLTEQAMLKNYKRAIDYSSMVSITDKNGLIVHANQNLCEVSGYFRQDFIGKKYDMVFHPEMPQKIKKELHFRMLRKEVYSNILKYQSKDGEVIWADTFVIPILDDKEDIVEYITIGCDISEVLHLNDEIQETQEELIYRLGEAVESRNKDSGHHIKRVAYYSKLLAKLYKLSDEEQQMIFAASSMHDVGKIAIPDSILLKPAKLTEKEWIMMKTHAEIGYKLFKDSKRPLLIAAADIAYQHHEYYNGKGYPRGLVGADISIFGRIVAIADVFDALCSTRPYKEPWEMNDVISLLEKEAGEQFDPDLIKLFVDNVDKFLEIQERYK